MEFAKRFGASDKVVSIYIAYCLPALLMSIFANKWAQRQQHPEKQMAFFALIGAIGGLSLLHTVSYSQILIVTALLGFVKEATQVLVNVYIKFNFAENEAKKAINNITATRFFIMVFGGALGGYLGGRNLFSVVFMIDAGTFFIAGLIFYSLKPTSDLKIVEEQNLSPFTFSQGMFRMILTFSVTAFVWFTLAEIATGSFYGMEYPLITTEFQIAPKMLGFIWCWHVIGTILSRITSQTLLDSNNLKQKVILTNMFFILCAAMLGVFGKSILAVGLQIGLLAFINVSQEVFSNFHLMKESSKTIFPFYNLYFRIVRQFALFVGSILPVFLLKRYSMISTNVMICMGLFILGNLFVFVKWMLFDKQNIVMKA